MTRADLGIGLAGLGRHGLRYARHLLAGEVPGARLVAVQRRDEREGRAFARAHGLSFHTTIASLAGHEEVGAIVAALPPSLHPEAVSCAAEHGKAILVEKPLATSTEAARRAIARARRAGIVAMVAQTLRYDPAVRLARTLLPRIGPLRFVAIGQRYEPSGRGWIDDRREGGVLLNIGVHGADLLRHLTGCEVAALHALGARPGAPPAEVAALMRLEPGGLLATLHVSRETACRSGCVELVGRDGRIAVDFVAGHVSLERRGEGRAIRETGPEPTLPLVLADFAAAVRGEREVAVPLEEGLEAVAIVERVAAAAAGAEDE